MSPGPSAVSSFLSSTSALHRSPAALCRNSNSRRLSCSSTTAQIGQKNILFAKEHQYFFLFRVSSSCERAAHPRHRRRRRRDEQRGVHFAAAKNDAAAATAAATAAHQDGDDTMNKMGGLKMFVVRHEKRPVEDPTFHVSLTEDGLSDASNVVAAKLQSHGITKVYASPFRRVLQTVQPFLSSAGLRAHVDWALYEHPEPNPEPVVAIPDDFHADFAIETNYEPHLGGNDIARCNGSFEAVHKRVRGLVQRLAESHGDGDVLLLATHQTSVHSLLHQQTGIPMDCFNVPMGTIVELRWRDILNRGEGGE